MDSALLLKPLRWMIKTVEAQADVITNLFFPFPTSRRHNHNRYTSFIPPNRQSQPTSPSSSSSSTLHTLIKKLTHGLMGAAYSCMVLSSALVLAVMIGVWVVNLWVEDPVIISEKLHFDYTESSPSAVFNLSSGGGNRRLPPLIWGEGRLTKTKSSGVPVGHTYTVTIILSMPESDLNLENGVFQLTVEVISTDGMVLIARSSKPCMLRYRSRLIRLTRTLILCVPVLLGFVQETQKLMVETVRYTEVMKPRSGLIYVTVSSRAGEMLRLPQLYEAEIIVKSRLPWRKEVIRDWKWTFYVWSCMWTYLIIVSLLVCCFRNVIFGGSGIDDEVRRDDDEVGLGWDDDDDEMEVKDEEEEEEVDSRKLRKWQSYRRKRKAELLVGQSRVDSEVEVDSSSGATSYTVGGNVGDYVPPTASAVDSAEDENVVDGVEVRVSSSSTSVRRRRP